MISNSYQFSGTSGFRTGANFTQYGASAITIMAWLKIPSNAGTFLVIFDIDDIAVETILMSGGVNYSFSLTTSGGGAASANIARASIEDGNWHHLCGVYDGSNIYIYLDGVAQGSPAALSGTIITAHPANLTIGWRQNSTGFLPANSLITEARVYSTALSADQIKALVYKRATGVESGISGYWSLGVKTDGTLNLNNLSEQGTNSTSTDLPPFTAGGGMASNRLKPYPFAPGRAR